MAKKAAPEVVEIRYDLFDLPTAQHKAGLAGLILAIRSLQERSKKDPVSIPPESIPDIIEGPDDVGVKIRFTPRSVKGLFDDLYDADLIESEPKEKPRTKGKGAAKKIIPPVKKVPLPVVDKKSGKEKEVEGYVYLDVTPRLAPLSPLFPAIPEWLKLWRNVLFQVIRDGRKQAPYKKRAAERFKNSPLKDAITGAEEGSDISDEESTGRGDGSSWDDLETGRQGKLSSALYIGAQGVNAEQIAFTGSTRHNLLLHFWPLSMLVFVPSFIDSDGKEHLGKRSEKDKSSHYVIAVPEVSGLRRFCEVYPRMLSRIGEEKRAYRPARAIIAVAAQSSLEFINHVAHLAEQTAKELLSRALNSVEFYHLMKPEPTKGAVLVGSGRVPDDPDLIEGYRTIVGRPGEPSRYRNPLFKAALIRALLRGKQWWAELLPLFMSRDWRFFVFASDTDKEAPDIAKLPWFWVEVGRRFEQDISYLRTRQEALQHMSPEEAERVQPTPDERMPEIVRRLVTKYVLVKAKDRSKERPEKFNEEKEHVSQSLFLEFRSRRDQAFVDHFAATFFAVGQWFDDKQQDFQILSSYLLDRGAEGRADLKTLTLAALSAVSWVPQEKPDKGDDE
jgi:CRISPR-associated protein Cmx8